MKNTLTTGYLQSSEKANLDVGLSRLVHFELLLSFNLVCALLEYFTAAGFMKAYLLFQTILLVFPVGNLLVTCRNDPQSY